MLTRKQFKEVLDELKQLCAIEDEIDRALKLLSPDFSGFGLEKPISLILKTLEYAMDDEEWISYWIYDMEWGKKARLGTVTEKDGTNIPIKTINDLYDVLTAETGEPK